MDENKIKNTIDSDELQERLLKARENLVKAYILKNFADRIQPMGEFLDQLESEIIKYALLISEENQKKAAFLLGIKAPTLCEKMKRYNIKLDSSLKQTAFPFLRSIDEIGRLVSSPDE